VRRMFLSVGLPVEELSRRRYGPLTDDGLEPGGFRELGGDEVEALRRAGEEVAGEVAKEVEGSPLMLAAEAPPEEHVAADHDADEEAPDLADRDAEPKARQAADAAGREASGAESPEAVDPSEGEATQLGEALADRGPDDEGEGV
jgi:hypothetical protein